MANIDAVSFWPYTVNTPPLKFMMASGTQCKKQQAWAKSYGEKVLYYWWPQHAKPEAYISSQGRLQTSDQDQVMQSEKVCCCLKSPQS